MIVVIKCLVVDDDRVDRDIIVSYISRLPGLILVGACKSGLEALDILQQEPVDLIILDAQLPDLSGLELLQSLYNPPLAIFATANTSYALVSYELDVVDYLLKPFPFDRFMRAIFKASDRLRNRMSVSTPLPAVAPVQNLLQANDHIFVKANHKTYKIAFKDIIFIQSMKEYVAFYLESGNKILALQSLRKLAGHLPADLFLQVHRSYIVPAFRVTSVHPKFVYLGKIKIPIGNSFRTVVKEKLLG